MSRKSYSLSRVFQTAFLALLAASSLSAEVSYSYPSAGEPSCFEIYVPAAGTLLVEAADALSSVELRLDFYGRLCGGESCGDADAWRWLERRPAGGLVEVGKAGSYLLCANAQDRDLPLREVKLTNGFLTEWVDKDGDPEEVEIDPDPTPLKDGDPEEVEIDPDPLTTAPRHIAEICRRMAADDYGDVMACASRLDPGTTVRADLGDGWGEDDDVFSFVLDELRTVHLTTTGAATKGFLLDRWGHRLGADESALDEGLRIVKTLAPGLYYVRLKGETGAYELTLRLE